MLLIDDLLLAPIKGVMWLCKEILEAAEQDRAAEGDRIKDRLRELYMLLETQQITEQVFDEEERVLLDRLDELEAASAADAAAGGPDGDDGPDGDEPDDEDGEDGLLAADAGEEEEEGEGEGEGEEDTEGTAAPDSGRTPEEDSHGAKDS
ncbi:MAG: gas vesicle protein GvpG [Polyangia bacterium]